MSDELLKAGERLADVLAQENAALKRLDFPAAVALVPIKAAALAELEKGSAGVALPAALGQNLRTLATENQVLLERAIAVQIRIVRIVARAATPPPGLKTYSGASSPRTTAIAVSTRA